MRRQRLLAALSVLILAVCVVPALAQWVSNGNKIFYDDGKVGVGTNNPNSPLQVVSNIGAGERPTILAKMTNSAPEAFNAAVRGMNRGTGENGIGVWGSHDGSGWGMYGTSETGIGVFGRTLTTANDAIGVRGLVVGGSNAVGVRGEASSSLSVNYGVLGTTNSGSGRGVMGENMATTGFAVGVRGLTNSQAGYGIFGSNQANSGLGIGVVGETWSADGRGVWGDAFNNTGVNYGVYGRTTSGDGYGVYSVGELDQIIPHRSSSHREVPPPLLRGKPGRHQLLQRQCHPR